MPNYAADFLKYLSPEQSQAEIEPPLSEDPIAAASQVADRRLAEKDEQARIENSEKYSDATRGLLGGIDTMQAMGGGAIALAGEATGFDSLRDWGLDLYEKNQREASLYEKPGFKSDPLGWVAYTAGNLLPSMAEAIGGAIVGSVAMPGPGTATGGLLGRTILKKGIKKLTNDLVKRGIEKKTAQKVATGKLLKSFGAKAGAVGATWQMEAGGNFGEGVDEYGVEDASVTAALGTGFAAALLELAGGNVRFIDKALGAETGKVFRRALKKGDGNLVARIAKEAALQSPQEAGQEMGQEFLSLVNLKLNDPNYKMFTPENLARMGESAGAGAVGGSMGAVPTAMVSKPRTPETVEPTEGEPVGGMAPQQVKPEKPKGPLEKAVGMAPQAPATEEWPIRQDVGVEGTQESVLNDSFGIRNDEGLSDVEPDQQPMEDIYGDLPEMRQETVVAQEVPPVWGEDEGAGLGEVDFKAHDAATSPANDVPEPSAAQKEAGNYKKGHVVLQGLDISIENPAGSFRKGVDEDGKAWETPIAHHYGYIKGTVGFDKDHLDIFLGPQAETADTVYVIDQKNKDGSFDEHKAVIGAQGEADALQIYLSNYEEGWDGAGAVTAMPVDEFKQWAKSDAPKKGALTYQQEVNDGEESKQPEGQRTEAGTEERDGTASEERELSEEIAKLPDYVKKIVLDGDFQGYVFPDGITPQKINDVWGDLLSGHEAVVEKNRPSIDQLRKERDGLKGDRSAKARERKKAIDDGIRDLESEAQAALYFSEEALNNAQENLTERITKKLETEHGIPVDETRDRVFDLIATLSDGRQNEYGWKKPIDQQLIDSVIEGRKKTKDENSTEQAEVVADSATVAEGETAGQDGVSAEDDQATGKEGRSSQAEQIKPKHIQVLRKTAKGKGLKVRSKQKDGTYPIIDKEENQVYVAKDRLDVERFLEGYEAKVDEGPLFDEDKNKSVAPEHQAEGVDDRELSEIVDEFNQYQRQQVEGDFKVHHLFDPPKKSEVVRLNDKVKVYVKDHGWMTRADAEKKIRSWEDHAVQQGKESQKGKNDNSDKVVISLFDLSGEWSLPWEQAGYDVYRFDIQDLMKNTLLDEDGNHRDVNVGDVHEFSTQFFNDLFASFDGKHVHAVLAACPCTDFAVSGARHFAAKDSDGRTAKSVALVHQTLATIEHFKPSIWAIENPVGRIEKLGGLPPWRLSFDPNHVGEDYTKKTLLWGRFNADMPVSPTEPTEGSKMHKKYGGKSLATKNARSVTPEGFAYSFFMANNAVDHPVDAIAWKYDRLDRGLVERAVNAGLTEKDIDSLVEDDYWQDLNDEAAEEALRNAIEGRGEGRGEGVVSNKLKYVSRLENMKTKAKEKLVELHEEVKRHSDSAGIPVVGGFKDGANPSNTPRALMNLKKMAHALEYGHERPGIGISVFFDHDGKKGRSKWDRKRLDDAFAEFEKDINTDFRGDDYYLIQEEDYAQGRVIYWPSKNSKTKIKGWHELESGLFAGVAFTYLENAPDYFIVSPTEKINVSGSNGIGTTLEGAVADLQDKLKKNAQFTYEIEEKEWSREDLEELANWKLRMVAKARGVEKADTARIKTLIDRVITSRTEKKPSIQKIDDLGEKIGGARKDLAVKTGKKSAAKKQSKGWRSRYHLVQIENEVVRRNGQMVESENNGKWAFFDTRKKSKWGGPSPMGRRYFDSEAEANEVLPLMVAAQKHRVYSVGDGKFTIYRNVNDRKRVRVIPEEFDSRDDAMRFMAVNAEKILTTKLNFGEEILPRPEVVYRSGVERRKGDVAGEDFMQRFGFRATEFGNWNNQEERQQVMNHAYDALLDMADILEIPPAAVSLNGELALAFGARGHGLVGAAAHYEPQYAVINLTKMAGAGHLAHEWFHALDHYVGRLDSKAKSEKTQNKNGNLVYPSQDRSYLFASHGFLSEHRSKARKELADAYKDLIKTMTHKAETYVEDTRRADDFVDRSRQELADRLKAIRDYLAKPLDPKYYKRKNKPASEEQLARFDQLAEMLINGESNTALETEFVLNEKQRSRWSVSGRRTNAVLDEMSAIYKAVRGRSGFSENGDNTIGRLAGPMRIYRERINQLKEAREETPKVKNVPTEFRNQAVAADQGRGDSYWSTPHELAARAFAAYVEDKLADQKAGNDFLAYHAHGAVPVPIYPEGLFRPYPEGEERKAVNKAFEKLFSTFETKETDTGIAMFSRGEVGKGVSVTLSDVEFDAAFARITAGRVNRKRFVIAATASDLPAAIQDDINKQGGNPNDIHGVFHRGKVYIVKDRITSEKMLEEVLFHEWHGHGGLFAMMGQDGEALQAKMIELYGMLKPGEMLRISNKYGFRLNRYAKALRKAGYSDDVRHATLMEELLAHMAMEHSQGKIATKIKEIIGMIRDWLRRNNFMALAELGESDLALLLKKARAYAEVGAWSKDGPAVAVDGNLLLEKLKEKGITEEMLVKTLSGAKFSAAYHGSPHSFDRFSTDNIGTGEGAQAYGYGLYFASSRAVAEHYKKALSDSAWDTADGLMSHFMVVEHMVREMERAGHITRHSSMRAIAENVTAGIAEAKSVDKYLRDYDMPTGQYAEMYQSAVSAAKNLDIKPRKGNLYQVELAPSEEEYLLWDELLSKQSKKVSDVLLRHPEFAGGTISDAHRGSDFYGFVSREIGNPSGRAKKMIETAGFDPYGDIGGFSNNQIASKYLHTLGIRGIKYLDGTSRGKGEGDYNYVIFSDDDVEITAKFMLRDKMDAAKKLMAEMTPDNKGLPFKKLSDFMPERMKQAIGGVLSNPHYGSRKSKWRTQAYELALERGARGNEIKYEVMAAKPEEGYAGLEGVRDFWHTAKKEEREQFDKLMVEGDINETVYSPEQLSGSKNPLGKPVPKKVQDAYFAARQTLEHASEEMFDRLGRLRLVPYEGTEYYDELVRLLDEKPTKAALAKKFNLNIHAVRAYRRIMKSRSDVEGVLGKFRREPSFDTLVEDIMAGRTKVEIQKNHSMKDNWYMNLYDEARVAVDAANIDIVTAANFRSQKYFKTLKDILARGEDHPMLEKEELYNAYLGVQEYDSELAKLRSQWGKVKGYMPRIRKDGEQHVKVYQVDDDGTFTEVWMQPAKTKGGANILRGRVEKNLKDYIPHSFDSDAVYEVVVEPNRATPEEIFLGIGSHRAIEGLLSKAFDKATDAGVIEDGLSVQRQVLRILADEISARGFGRHRLNRANHLIEGYETENVPGIMAQFVGGMAGWLSKSEFAMRSNRLMGQIPADRPNDKVWVREYVDDALKNSTYIDQWFGTARSFAALMYLGFKASSAMLNATQNYVWGQAKLSSYTKRATRRLLAAQRDVIKDHLLLKAGKEGVLTEEERWVLDEGLRRGRSHANYVRAMSGLDDNGGVLGKGQSGLRWLTEKAMIPFQAVETYWNREPALLAAYRVFKAKGMTKEQALKKAERFVDDVHFVIGKENVPAMLRKMGPLGRTLYTFQSYTHNYLLGMLTSLTRGEFGVVMRSLTALMLFGGLAAMPFGDDLDKWYRRMFGERPLRMLERWLRETGNQYVDFGDQVADFVLHGAPALGGVNFSRAIGVNIPWLSPDDESLAERVTGVWGGMAQKVRYASNAAAKGDAYRAVEQLSPEAMANIMRAYRLYADGTETMSGRPIFGSDGRQQHYTPKEAIIRSFGFMPLKPSKETEKRWDARRAKQYWQDRKADLLARYRASDKRMDVLRDIVKFNRKILKSPSGILVSPITSQTLRRALRAKPNRRELVYNR